MGRLDNALIAFHLRAFLFWKRPPPPQNVGIGNPEMKIRCRCCKHVEMTQRTVNEIRRTLSIRHRQNCIMHGGEAGDRQRRVSCQAEAVTNQRQYVSVDGTLSPRWRRGSQLQTIGLDACFLRRRCKNTTGYRSLGLLYFLSGIYSVLPAHDLFQAFVRAKKQQVTKVPCQLCTVPVQKCI